jgi:PPE family protein
MSEGILPGGCIPPDDQLPRDFPRLPDKWPDKCWPPYPLPPEDDPGEDGPGTLSSDVDWMTYSHPELYRMVSGMDLTGAMSVSAGWAKLGDELAEIGEELRRLLEQTSAAWQGPASELARGSVGALADWSAQTGAGATEVSAAITREVDAANTARNSMPAPVFTERPDLPHPVEPATSPQSAFSGGDFTSAQSVVVDPGPVPPSQPGHAQAARVMATFQAETNEIYGTVPQFAPPNLSRMSPTDPNPNPNPPPQPPQPQPTGPAQTGGGGGAVVGGGGYAGGGAPGSANPGATATPRPGANVSAAPEGAPRPGAAPAAASGGRPAGGMPMGGMPMGGAGGRGSEDTERKSKYVEEDDDLWGLGENRPVPPVIGEDRRRA